jgi:hypothetical protein
VSWPAGKKFAFTFCDDTDFSTRANVAPVYDFLADLGMRTTKLVWLFAGASNEIGESCEQADYLAWVLALQQRGFEIGLHNVAPDSSARERVERGLARFQELFGQPPTVHCNHGFCRDNLYWGEARLTGWRRTLFNLYSGGNRQAIALGHVPGSAEFWGDHAAAQVRYVRNFTFDELNTLRCCPGMPYHDARKPYVNFWFAATNASSPKYFRQNFSRQKIDALIAEGGLCIAYVHFGAEFYHDGQLDDYFRELVEYIARQDGWFAPVSEILDHLRQGGDRQTRRVSAWERQKLELRWLAGKFGKKMGI